MAAADDDLAQGETAPSGAPSGIAPGTRVGGMYVIEEPIGAGGMGVVYRARDERLDRAVAIKLGTVGSAAALVRARREALALAKLSHPNVVLVFQVGEHDGRLYIAMEHIDGGNARAWIAARPRTWREIVTLYAAAGDGLAAAHAAGLVHRDVKPDNVLVGADGRPRVGDFGLARAGVTQDDEPPTSDPALRVGVTAAGAVLGTLGYMPPEQLDGGDLDARADQFAFCASLWEALHGARPFAGRDPDAQIAAIERGEPRTSSASDAGDARDVPAHVTAALRRGLAADRDDRWPSMTALVTALRRDPTAARRRRLAIGGVGATVAIAGALLAWPHAAALDACGGGAAEIASVWGWPRTAEVRALIAARTHDAGLAARAQAALDDRARRWTVAYRAICESGARGWSAGQVARGMDCLAERRDALAGATALIAGAGPLAGDRVTAMVADLALPEACTDAAYLAGDLPPPPDPPIAAAVATDRRALDRARRLHQFEDVRDAAILDGAVLTSAFALGYKPLIADALTLRAILDRGDLHAEFADLRDAYFLAEAASARVTAASAAGYAATVLLDLSRYDEATNWARLAADAAHGLADPRARAEALLAGAAVATDTGHAAEAIELADQAIALAGASGNPIVVERAIYERAAAYYQLGRLAEGIADVQRAIAIIEHELGPGAPELVALDMQLGTDFGTMGRETEAVDVLRKALALAERLYGRDSDNVAGVLDQLGGALDGAGNPQEALEIIDRGLAISVRTSGPHSFNYGVDLANRGMVLSDLGRFDEAIATNQRALKIWIGVVGPDDPVVGHGWVDVGLEQYRAERDDEAIASLSEARRVFEKSAPQHPELARALTVLGALRAKHGDLAGGRADLEHALALRQGPDIDPSDLVVSEIELADVLRQQGDRRGAVELAQSAARNLGRTSRAPSEKVLSMFDRILGKGVVRVKP